MEVRILRAQRINFTSDQGEVVRGVKVIGELVGKTEAGDDVKGVPVMQEFIRDLAVWDQLKQVPGVYDVTYEESFSSKGKPVSKFASLVYKGNVTALPKAQ
jgi:hypothetical protein